MTLVLRSYVLTLTVPEGRYAPDVCHPVSPEVRRNLLLGHVSEFRNEYGALAIVASLMERNSHTLSTKVVTFSRAFVWTREVVLRITVPFAGASIETSKKPQIAEICFFGQKTFSLGKKTPSSQGLTTRYEQDGERKGSVAERAP